MVIEVYQCIMLIGWSFSLGSGHRRPLQNVLHVFGGCGQIANAFQRPGRKSMYGKIHPHIPETFRYITSTRTVPNTKWTPRTQVCVDSEAFFLQHLWCWHTVLGLVELPMQMTHDLHRNDGKNRGGCDGDGVKARLYIADIANHSFLRSPSGTFTTQQMRPLNFCLFVWLHLNVESAFLILVANNDLRLGYPKASSI